MDTLHVEATRGGLVESSHGVHAAVVDAGGRLAAAAGDPALVTFWRSAAKPFQAMPLLEDGAADRFGLGEEELALTCASHSAEPAHRSVVIHLLERIGLSEDDLACGPHPSLSPAVHADVLRAGTTMTPVWSNCSGKHAGMLALARHHDWPTAGYEVAGHPVQERLAAAVAAWTGVARPDLRLGVDGCTTVCYGLPLRAMALAWARFGVGEGAAARRLREAMVAQPHLVAGTGRLDTEVIAESGGRVVAKVGAEGVYGAAIPERGLGVAIKVQSGDMRAAGVALAGVLQRLLGPGGDWPPAFVELLAAQAARPIRNTRARPTGEVRLTGTLRNSG